MDEGVVVPRERIVGNAIGGGPRKTFLRRVASKVIIERLDGKKKELNKGVLCIFFSENMVLEVTIQTIFLKIFLHFPQVAKIYNFPWQLIFLYHT